MRDLQDTDSRLRDRLQREVQRDAFMASGKSGAVQFLRWSAPDP